MLWRLTTLWSSTAWFRLLMWTIALAGTVITAWSLFNVYQRAQWQIILLLLSAAMVAELLTVQVYEADEQKISLSFTIAVTMAAVIIYPQASPLISLTAALVHVLQRRQRQPAKVLVNLAIPVIAAATATAVFTTLQPFDSAFGPRHLPAALLAVLAFYIVNVGTIVLMISLHTGQSLMRIARQTSWFGPANILLGLTGAFLAGAHEQLGPIGISLFIAPVLLLRFTLAAYARNSQRTIATLRAARTRAEDAEARYRGLFEEAADPILVTDDAGRVLEANAAAVALIGSPVTPQTPLHLADVVAEGTRVTDSLLASLQRTGHWQCEVAVWRHDRTTMPVEWRARWVEIPTGSISISALRDISERRAAQEQLAYRAFHDPLTGLPNRALFMDRLSHALTRSQRHPLGVAVIFADLDRLKVINDSLGHEAGDQILIDIAHRLQQSMRPSDLVARMSGDEFTILVDDITDANDAVRIAWRIMASLHRPFQLAGRDVHVSASLGVALDLDGRRQPDDLLREADIAMYRAKRKGGAEVEVFDASMHARAVERLELESELRQASDQGQFLLHYQPALELSTGRLIGMEALIRWRHPVRGLVAPLQFIPLAEETGLILPIGRWALREACRQARAWQDRYPSDPPRQISVNLSARQLQQPDFTADVARVLDETGLEPQALVLEITESILMAEAESHQRILGRLEELGVQLAIDDFGTGYSSLSYLKRFPLKMLKVDRSFVAGLGRDREDAAIIQAVTTLAHSLDMSVTAEGVERADQVPQLRGLGCEYGQGYYFAKPLSSTDVDMALEQCWKTADTWVALGEETA